MWVFSYFKTHCVALRKMSPHSEGKAKAVRIPGAQANTSGTIHRLDCCGDSACADLIDDPLIETRQHGGANEPPPVFDIASPGFHALPTTVRQVCPGALPLPYLVVAAADSKHFTAITENSQRFLSIRFGSDDTGRIRGTNERISLQESLRVDPFLSSTAIQRGVPLKLWPIAPYSVCQPRGWSSDAWLVSRLRAPFFAEVPFLQYIYILICIIYNI